MSDVARAFDAAAADYDAGRRRLVPVFDDLYGTALEALALTDEPVARVLDLGAGTGVLSRFVRDAHPGVRLTLVDGAANMLDRARGALGDDGSYVTADLREPLPDGPWDAVVSALAIHHLPDADKRDLFARIHAGLRPGGVFVNAEVVAAPTARLEATYVAWHERRARAAGSDDAEWAGARERMAHDRCATVEDQLDWLREAGFAEADCLFKAYCFAVLVASKRSVT